MQKPDVRVKKQLRANFPTSIMNLRAAAILFGIDLVIGMLGYVLLENYKILDALYMTVITVATVGFTEVQPLSETGRFFTSIYILVNIGIFAYILAVFSYYIIQGEIFKTMHANLINSKVDKLNNHIILCGFGRFGQEVASQLTAQKMPFVVIEHDASKIELIQQIDPNMLYVYDDATHDEALIKAGLERARAVISALPADSDNVFIVLTARQINPTVRIISRVAELKSQKKLIKAGADHAVMPEQLGGFYMATLITKPSAVEFFYFITNEYESDIGFEEIGFNDLPAAMQSLSIGEMRIRERTGANVIGFKDPAGRYKVNPTPDVRLSPGASFIILGNHEQLEKLSEFFGKG
ncbi:MAG: potassium channel protein [Saprospiraceae bacterium]|nr:potassium channel protein [Saprospiraceae bacterium]